MFNFYAKKNRNQSVYDMQCGTLCWDKNNEHKYTSKNKSVSNIYSDHKSG